MHLGRIWWRSWYRRQGMHGRRSARNRSVEPSRPNGQGRWKSQAAAPNAEPANRSPSRSLPWNAALVSGGLALVGDALAQMIQNAKAEKKDGFDWARACRMGTFGFFFYGPYQHYWYGYLDRLFPMKKKVSHFVSKVVLNQIVLAPVVLLVVFSWNLAWQGKHQEIEAKVKNDLLSTMVNGWKFWVPASSINFWLVPLRFQVLYMSSCGVYWNAYLSLASNKR